MKIGRFFKALMPLALFLLSFGKLFAATADSVDSYYGINDLLENCLDCAPPPPFILTVLNDGAWFKLAILVLAIWVISLVYRWKKMTFVWPMYKMLLFFSSIAIFVTAMGVAESALSYYFHYNPFFQVSFFAVALVLLYFLITKKYGNWILICISSAIVIFFIGSMVYQEYKMKIYFEKQNAERKIRDDELETLKKAVLNINNINECNVIIETAVWRECVKKNVQTYADLEECRRQAVIQPIGQKINPYDLRYKYSCDNAYNEHNPSVGDEATIAISCRSFGLLAPYSNTTWCNEKIYQHFKEKMPNILGVDLIRSDSSGTDGGLFFISFRGQDCEPGEIWSYDIKQDMYTQWTIDYKGMNCVYNNPTGFTTVGKNVIASGVKNDLSCNVQYYFEGQLPVWDGQKYIYQAEPTISLIKAQRWCDSDSAGAQWINY